jgi:hypothetical protein
VQGNTVCDAVTKFYGVGKVTYLRHNKISRVKDVHVE